MKHIALALTILCCGCTVIPSTPVSTPSNIGRFEIISSQVFTDARTYDRNILLIKDKVTGHEYLAVMGAGVVDMYSQGKTQVEN